MKLAHRFRTAGDLGRWSNSSLQASQGMPVPIFVYEIFCRHLADGSEPLRTPRTHPDKVSGCDWIPRIAEPVNSATFEHDEPVLHHVHFDHAQGGPQLVEHCVYRTD